MLPKLIRVPEKENSAAAGPFKSCSKLILSSSHKHLLASSRKLPLSNINQYTVSSSRPLSKTAPPQNSAVRAFGYASHRGLYRTYNEDRIQAMAFPTLRFFGVYDGHGGAACCEFLVAHLHRYVLQANLLHSYSESALTQAFLQADKAFIHSARVTGDSSGSCALVILVAGDRCIVANTGDSRAVLCRRGNAYDLSMDHKPLIERERIVRAGGQVYARAGGPPRVLPGNLSVSRAFGDFSAKDSTQMGNPGVLIPDPTVISFSLDSHCEFILACTDGVFDVMSSKEAVSIAQHTLADTGHHSCQAAAAAVIRTAMKKQSTDNVSAVVITLRSTRLA